MCCSYYTATRYTEKPGLAVVDFDWRHLIVKLSNRTSVRCKDLSDICCTSRDIAHFVLNFVAMVTRVGRGKIRLAAFDGSFSKTPLQMQKSRRYLLLVHKPRYSQFCPKFRCYGNGGRSEKKQKSDCQHWMASPRKPPYRRNNLADISYTSRVMAHFVPNFVAMATGVNRG